MKLDGVKLVKEFTFFKY